MVITPVDDRYIIRRRPLRPIRLIKY
jgi:hypothetical protein